MSKQFLLSFSSLPSWASLTAEDVLTVGTRASWLTSEFTQWAIGARVPGPNQQLFLSLCFQEFCNQVQQLHFNFYFPPMIHEFWIAFILYLCVPLSADAVLLPDPKGMQMLTINTRWCRIKPWFGFHQHTPFQEMVRIWNQVVIIASTEGKRVKPEREGEKGEREKEKGGKGVVKAWVYGSWTPWSLIPNNPIITYGRAAPYYRYEN